MNNIVEYVMNTKCFNTCLSDKLTVGPLGQLSYINKGCIYCYDTNVY